MLWEMDQARKSGWECIMYSTRSLPCGLVFNLIVFHNGNWKRILCFKGHTSTDRCSELWCNCLTGESWLHVEVLWCIGSLVKAVSKLRKHYCCVLNNWQMKAHFAYPVFQSDGTLVCFRLGEVDLGFSKDCIVIYSQLELVVLYLC